MNERRPLSPEKSLAAAIRSIASSLTKIREESEQHSDLFKKVATDLYQAVKRVETAPDELSESISSIANYGWYVDPTWPYSLPERIAKKIADEGYISVEPLICALFEQRATPVRNRLTEYFPNRRIVIESAFLAHEQQKYELSVPIFLIQADGIAKEIFDSSLFISSERQKICAIEQPMYKYHMMRPLIAALAGDTTLNLSSGKRSKDFSGLNRHLVLHGENIDYATHPNSLKCISLLSNLCLFRELITHQSIQADAT